MSPEAPRAPSLAWWAAQEYLPDWLLTTAELPDHGFSVVVTDVQDGKSRFDVPEHVVEPLMHHLQRDPRVRHAQARRFDHRSTTP